VAQNLINGLNFSLIDFWGGYRSSQGWQRQFSKPSELCVGVILKLSSCISNLSSSSQSRRLAGQRWKALPANLEIYCWLVSFCLGDVPESEAHGYLSSIVLNIYYSCLRQSTGFFVAVLQVCQLTVNKDIIIVISPANANMHQLRLIL
jgi:hypothetical protein